MTLIFDLTSAQGIDANQARFFLRIKRETAPGPVLRINDEFSLHGVHVHVGEFLDEFGLTSDVEIVEAGLPELG